MARLRFGAFLAPFHPPGIDPTRLLEHDLELVEALDRMGFDEVWVGEHHSAGTEIIASPEIFIAAALQRTRSIKLGTGVISASYHNPLWVAERAVQLDHMARGRFILGLGPGALPTDAMMIGLDMKQTRRLLEDAVDVITRLMDGSEPVTFENDRWSLKDARLHLRPYSHPYPEIAIAGVNSPSGPRLAGRHGHSLLSIGATTAAGFDMLAMHWDVMEEQAAAYGTVVDRSRWRLVGMMHIAETREQAYADVARGITTFFDYAQNTAAFALSGVGSDLDQSATELCDLVNESGLGTVGTPDDAARQIERLWKQSDGGFGTYLQMAHDWASPAAKLRSFDLFIREVAPRFTGQSDATMSSRAIARALRPTLLADNNAAVELARTQYEAEREARR